MDDWDLLEQFRLTRSEQAFSELVSRHAGFVLATCRRRLRDAHLSEDAGQAVFLALALRPPVRMSSSHKTLAGWLYQTSVYACNNAAQARRTRESHESRAAVQAAAASRAQRDRNGSTEVELMLDQALAELSRKERDALLLRYYQDQSVQQVGAALGISSNTATKRIGRAIERMRALLASRGLAISPLALADAIARATQQPLAPPAFVSNVVAIASGRSVASGIVKHLAEGVHEMIRVAQMKLVASVATIVIGAGGLLAVNQLIAKTADPKPPPPAAGPATAPAATSNTPKGVLKEFAAAVRKGDSSKLPAISVAETDQEKELVRAACAYIDATGAFSKAVGDKFGKDAKKELNTLFELTPVGRFTMFIETTVDRVPEQIDGDFASFQPPGVDDLTLWVQNVNGQWKLATGRMCEHWTPENWQERIGLMDMAAQGLQRMKVRVADGEYASFAELKRDLGPLVRQNR